MLRVGLDSIADKPEAPKAPTALKPRPSNALQAMFAVDVAVPVIGEPLAPKKQLEDELKHYLRWRGGIGDPDDPLAWWKTPNSPPPNASKEHKSSNASISHANLEHRHYFASRKKEERGEKEREREAYDQDEPASKGRYDELVLAAGWLMQQSTWRMLLQAKNVKWTSELSYLRERNQSIEVLLEEKRGLPSWSVPDELKEKVARLEAEVEAAPRRTWGNPPLILASLESQNTQHQKVIQALEAERGRLGTFRRCWQVFKAEEACGDSATPAVDQVKVDKMDQLEALLAEYKNRWKVRWVSTEELEKVEQERKVLRQTISEHEQEIQAQATRSNELELALFDSAVKSQEGATSRPKPGFCPWVDLRHSRWTENGAFMKRLKELEESGVHAIPQAKTGDKQERLGRAYESIRGEDSAPADFLYATELSRNRVFNAGHLPCRHRWFKPQTGLRGIKHRNNCSLSPTVKRHKVRNYLPRSVNDRFNPVNLWSTLQTSDETEQAARLCHALPIWLVALRRGKRTNVLLNSIANTAHTPLIAEWIWETRSRGCVRRVTVQIDKASPLIHRFVENLPYRYRWFKSRTALCEIEHGNNRSFAQRGPTDTVGGMTPPPGVHSQLTMLHSYLTNVYLKLYTRDVTVPAQYTTLDLKFHATFEI
ncbi:hypothetical protein BKA70DRAFT_1481417 [Coprinopsis sp. MPI-PUGE-AT-0042]|nr:hypothetical protein BKA70DRAFT_1481417 [Coprinopsis sp. MPI-PUGE-AT-0042]